ncbi:uncharacterized protein STEHIDRAFT_166042 [Stereum hirsutum FP-91666 SS1]|uniref:uncharacterized protein n=1 Tax=Stereum hirsutum (strain FP-91666) TaxID=721885 RepID=UPI000440BA70|nr:uncharacterized protein STEHIDRAFT_166042 [Stereum hirsutum FP-91666 SS1]EIM89691.1 hypothetical protein STEHIDRAFT_166042 [Stereum hirsutum FP-91666 SS1]
MLSSAFFVLALLGHASCAPSFDVRDTTPTDTDLLLSCPGAAGSPNVRDADRCTLINIVNNPDVRPFVAIGDAQLNCDGGTEAKTVTIGGSTSTTTTFTVNANLGISFEGVSIGGGASSESGTTTVTSKSTTFTVSPGRQVVMTAGILQHSQSGNVQVNYGDRVDGHYEWYTGATVTQLTPTDDTEFDIHESACGTDPKDPNNDS